jgi:hypothetical protein
MTNALEGALVEDTVADWVVLAIVGTVVDLRVVCTRASVVSGGSFSVVCSSVVGISGLAVVVLMGIFAVTFSGSKVSGTGMSIS